MENLQKKFVGLPVTRLPAIWNLKICLKTEEKGPFRFGYRHVWEVVFEYVEIERENYYIWAYFSSICKREYRIQAYLSFIQRKKKSLELVCSLEDFFFLFNLTLEVVYSRSFEMNRQQICRGLRFYLGWMKGTLVYNIPSLLIHPPYIGFVINWFESLLFRWFYMFLRLPRKWDS